jgi:DNA-binding PadR family transcriptional regulator
MPERTIRKTSRTVAVHTPTTTEAAVLALLATEGERSGYDLAKILAKAIGHVWSPARSHLYAVLPRLVRAGLASDREVAQTGKPDKRLYRITPAGQAALQRWFETVEPGAEDVTLLKLFVGGLTTHEVLVRQLDQYTRDVAARLAVYRKIEPTNTGEGHDRYHRYLLERSIDRAERDLRWAEGVRRSLQQG